MFTIIDTLGYKFINAWSLVILSTLTADSSSWKENPFFFLQSHFIWLTLTSCLVALLVWFLGLKLQIYLLWLPYEWIFCTCAVADISSPKGPTITNCWCLKPRSNSVGMMYKWAEVWDWSPGLWARTPSWAVIKGHKTVCFKISLRQSLMGYTVASWSTSIGWDIAINTCATSMTAVWLPQAFQWKMRQPGFWVNCLPQRRELPFGYSLPQSLCCVCLI